MRAEKCEGINEPFLIYKKVSPLSFDLTSPPLSAQ